MSRIHPLALRVVRWLHRNFFDGWHNALLAVLGVWLLAATLPDLWRWLVTDSRFAPANFQECQAAGGACWAFLQAKWRLILFGTFPYDEQWRPALAIGLFIAMVGASCLRSAWTSPRRRVVMLTLEDRLFKRPLSSQNTPRRSLGHAPAWLLGAAPAR